ncbi:MAG: hypothetical protein JWS12_638 [Candidatus Saccharibacteria bacterium]|nr:hypothetical protein [Candidatus Saccharibacteria bacterium]
MPGAEKLQLTPMQEVVVVRLACNGPETSLSLMQAFELGHSTVYNHLDALTEAGLIAATVASSDVPTRGRQPKLYSVSEEGTYKLIDYFQEKADRIAEVLEALRLII